MSVTDAPPARPELDRMLRELRTGADHWAALPVPDRARVFREVSGAVAGVAREWAETAARAKNIPDGSPLAGEEWMSGPYAALESSAAYARAYEAITRGRSPADGLPTRTVPGGRTAVRVLPLGLQQRVLFHGFSAEVWMPPGVSPERLRREAGLDAGTVGRSGGVGLVLGAGNISSIAPLDAFYELVAAGRTSLVKLNPTFADLLDIYERALAPLIHIGAVRVVNGDGAVGSYLATHDGVDKVHITGSQATHDTIVWGRGEEAERRRAERDPRLAVPITSELGGVSPIIVVPGTWSDADLRFQAEHVATMRLHNAGHNCIAGQMVVLGADWPQRDAFLAELRGAFARLPAREPWYPGSADRLREAVAAHAGAETINGRVLLESTGDDPACDTEYFAPVLAWKQVAGTGSEFLRAAVVFANDRLAGTLGANVVVDPAARRSMGAAFEEALADLRYGTIAVNAWTAVGFQLAGATWGAFPGNTIEDVGSGIDVVHNGHLLAGPERTVVTGPFREFPRSVPGGEFSLFPKPPWFAGARTAAITGERLTGYAAAPSWARLLGVLVPAFRA
ncbi:aldehyde dehydrogenase family protein [Myceligenerans xiligouense]|uniref:Aldehyde dehydrogenase family protein n=1 Tax=Myceligenerans xiligouense TaxID=253184 RepID=A0A3N4ZKK0_9MICO|nr:aldehyde dehydrogenase family protein [Myceligenerans xiligouense]RPF20451.1 aldehyde dehydrogenase family protein [Myceligenerans xiligouense]